MRISSLKKTGTKMKVRLTQRMPGVAGSCKGGSEDGGVQRNGRMHVHGRGGGGGLGVDGVCGTHLPHGRVIVDFRPQIEQHDRQPSGGEVRPARMEDFQEEHAWCTVRVIPETTDKELGANKVDEYERPPHDRLGGDVKVPSIH